MLPMAFTISVKAQKLPNVQTASLRAPADIKIDGMASEWADRFQAHNNATTLFYTLSNNDDNLYLTIQAQDDNYVVKCIRQGIIFTINPGQSTAVSVTYPEKRAVRIDISGNILKKLDKPRDPAARKAQNDSLIDALNLQVVKNLQKIKVTGIKAIPDSILSVNNNAGIASAARFNDKRFYTYELAIPLKYLELSADQASTISYNIKMIGQMADDKNNTVFITESDFMKALNYTTDFTGKYTLAKKP